MAKRIILGILLLGSSVLLPFPVSLFIALFGLVYFDWYIEALLIAVFMDMIYAPGSIDGLYSSQISTGAFIFLILIEYLKTRLRFYNAKSF